MTKQDLVQRFCGYFRRNETKSMLRETAKLAVMLLISLLFAIVVILIASKEPGEAIRVFLFEPFADSYNFCRILTESLPLMFTGVAVCIMMHAGQFNMFVEGGFFLGAFVSAVLAPELASESAPFIVPFFCIVVGATAAGLVGYIPAKLKSRLGVDEFVSSLMLNYIVLWVVLYLVSNVCGDPDGVNVTKYLEDYAKLPFLSADNELSMGILFAVAAAVLGWVFLFRTKWGYALRITGRNPRFAAHCGMNTRAVVTYSQVIGASVAGFGGGVYMLGNYYRFSWRTLPNYGFDGFVIAIMVRNNPMAVPLAALFLGYLRVGSQLMAQLTDVQNEMIYIIQGLIIILFGAKFLLELTLRRKKKAEEPKEPTAPEEPKEAKEAAA